MFCIIHWLSAIEEQWPIREIQNILLVVPWKTFAVQTCLSCEYITSQRIIIHIEEQSCVCVRVRLCRGGGSRGISRASVRNKINLLNHRMYHLCYWSHSSLLLLLTSSSSFLHHAVCYRVSVHVCVRLCVCKCCLLAHTHTHTRILMLYSHLYHYIQLLKLGHGWDNIMNNHISAV